MKGMPGKSPCATQIASPGIEWDNYAGVENMTSTAIVIANNIIDGWGSAVQLDAARDVAIVHNTVADGTGVRFNHRTPHDQMGNVILNGNSDIRIWNDILPSISLATGEMKPAFESNNVIWKGGGGGAGDVTSMPIFAGAAADYALAPGSPGDRHRPHQRRDTLRRFRKPPPRRHARHRCPRAGRPGGGVPLTAQAVTRAAAPAASPPESLR